MRRLLALLLLLPVLPTATAAESYDGCAGFIDRLPTTISTQGVWCLRKDLATTITHGAAIIVAANNVTIDCNGFKIGGLGAGPGTFARGIDSYNRLNTTVRNCAIRGFHIGMVTLGETGGHLVEDNRFDQILSVGIWVIGEGNLVQRNRIFDLGAADASVTAIRSQGDVRDNTIDGIFGAYGWGIEVLGSSAEIRGNRLRNFHTLYSTGITLPPSNSAIDNRILGGPAGTVDGIAIKSDYSPGQAFCRDNLIANFAVGIAGCDDNGGNVVHGEPPP